ncbi:MAG: mechanosensitive ion channel family protein [Dysgonamonadaceae bacterium]|jgi:small-conductance mechanosensitive channel|nr:mechanosensitive ion channel family protein [Dysgonamonadaceae bacterium]
MKQQIKHLHTAITLLFLFLFAGLAQEPQAGNTSGAPVAPFNDTIFSVHAKLGPYSPEERAGNIEYRIRELDDDAGFSTDSLAIVPDGNTLDIVYRDIIVMSISDADTVWFNQSKEQVAAYYKRCIAQSIDQYREDTGLVRMLVKIGLVIAILAVFFFIVKYTGKLFRVFHNRILALKGVRIKGITFKSYNLLDEERATNVALFLLKIVKYICLIVVLYFTVTLTFSVFPETRGLAGKLLDYVLTPLSRIVGSIVDYIPKAVTIVVIVLIFRYLIRGVKFFAGEIEKEKLKIKGFYPDWAMPTYHIVRTLLYAFMFILIFPYLPKSDSKIFQGVSVFIGVIVSLGSTSLIGNLVAGLVLTYMRPFKIGDNIKIGEIQGSVTEKTPFVTRIKTLKNEEVTIPNSNIMSVYTTNYTNSSQKHKLILYTSVTVGYDVSWRQVHELLLAAAGRTPHVLQTPPPFVLQRALNDFYAEYQINIYITEDKLMMRIYSDLYQNIQDVFNEAGIELVSPHYRAGRDGNPVAMPKEYLEGMKAKS